MKLDLSEIVKDLDGIEIIDGITKKTSTYGQSVGRFLQVKTEIIDPIKAYGWAVKLFTVGEIEIDESDKEILKQEINGAGRGFLTNTILCYVLKKLNALDSSLCVKK